MLIETLFGFWPAIFPSYRSHHPNLSIVVCISYWSFARSPVRVNIPYCIYKRGGRNCASPKNFVSMQRRCRRCISKTVLYLLPPSQWRVWRQET